MGLSFVGFGGKGRLAVAVVDLLSLLCGECVVDESSVSVIFFSFLRFFLFNCSEGNAIPELLTEAQNDFTQNEIKRLFMNLMFYEYHKPIL